MSSVRFIIFGFFLSSPLVGQETSLAHDFQTLDYSDYVEFRNGDGSESLTSSTAKRKVASFVKKVAPSEIKTLHKGFSENKVSYYGIIRLETKSGNHRLFYYCEKEKGKYKITKVRIHERYITDNQKRKLH